MPRSKALKFLLLIMLVHATLGALVFRYGTDLQDEGLLNAWSKRILEGELPYTDFYAVQAPGTFYVQAALTKVAGASLLVGRVFMQFEGLLIIALAYGTVRCASQDQRAGIVAALATATFSVAHHFRVPWYSPDACIGVLSATWLACIAIRKRSISYVFASGVVIGFATLFKQNHGVFAAASIGSMLSWQSWSRLHGLPMWPRLARSVGTGITLVSGAIAGVGTYLVYYVIAGGSMRMLWLNCFVWSSEAKDLPSPLQVLGYPLYVFSLAHKADWTLTAAGLGFMVGVALVLWASAPKVARLAGVILIGVALSLGADGFVRIYVLSFVNILMFGIAAAALLETRYGPEEKSTVASACALAAMVAAANTYAGAIPGGGWGRMVGTWSGSLLTFGIAAHLLYWHEGVVAHWWARFNWVPPRFVAASFGLTSLAISAGLLIKNQAFRPGLDVAFSQMTGVAQSEGWRGLRGDPTFVRETDAVIRAIRQMPKASRDKIYVFPLNCAIYPLADAHNATRFDSHQVDFLAPSQFAQVLAELEHNRPAAIVYQPRPNPAAGLAVDRTAAWVRDSIRAPVLAFIHAHYRLEKSWNYYELWLPLAEAETRGTVSAR